MYSILENYHRRPKIQRVFHTPDLTYGDVGNNWNYICILLDLCNREIVGYGCGKNKNAKLFYDAFAKVKTNLKNICIFHTDRGSEFKNYLLDDLIERISY